MKLYLVEMHEDDQDYDIFEEGAVWANSREEAEAIVRAEVRFDEYRVNQETRGMDHFQELWITNPEWKLVVKEAPVEGVVLVHWHAG